MRLFYSVLWWVSLPLVLLRPVKGFLLCQQWKTKAREGRIDK